MKVAEWHNLWNADYFSYSAKLTVTLSDTYAFPAESWKDSFRNMWEAYKAANYLERDGWQPFTHIMQFEVEYSDIAGRKTATALF